MNNTIKIKVGSPLLRPGLTIETEVSEKYAAEAAKLLIDIARSINAESPEEITKRLMELSRNRSNNP